MLHGLKFARDGLKWAGLRPFSLGPLGIVGGGGGEQRKTYISFGRFFLIYLSVFEIRAMFI